MLEARTAVYEWALRSARGELPGLDWVDTELRPQGEPFAIVRDGDQVRFRHLPLGDDLPVPMVEAAEDAQAQGLPTALEFVQQILARAQWLTSSRQLLWTPHSPVPALLAQLVEAYGIDVELHERDADVLTKLVVHLPTWYPRRGELGPAFELLAAVDRPTIRPDTEGPALFTCTRGQAHGALRIQSGVVVSTPTIALGWVPTERFPHELLRLLPAWQRTELATSEAS